MAHADPRLVAIGSRGIIEKNKNDDEFMDANIYDRHRLTLGIPEGSRDMIVGTSTLAEGNFDFLNSISWTKGCYVGQELTARMHHRALVKKRLFPVRISGAPPSFGAIVYLNDADIGTMRSANGDVGLALLNLEAAKKIIAEDLAVTSETANLRLYRPEWMRI